LNVVGLVDVIDRLVFLIACKKYGVVIFGKSVNRGSERADWLENLRVARCFAIQGGRFI